MTGKSKLIKTLSVILALVMLLGVMPMGSLVASAATEGPLTYKVSGDKAVIISCDFAASGDFVIPETLGSYPVVKIDINAFSDRNNLISVTIPDCVEAIGSGAFSECDRLAVVKIGKGVTSIGNNAFSNSIALEKIEVAKENKAYISENGALYNKDKTDLLVFPASNTVESFTVAENVTEIKAGAFLGTKHLKSVVIGDKVTTIGANAFLDSMSLETISLGKSVKTIGADAFKNCSKLVGFAVSADNNVLKSDAFGVLYSKDGTQLIKYPAGNTSEKYEVAEGTEVINLCAFENAIALKEITIPLSVTKIESSAFSGCLALSKVNYAGSDVEWANDVEVEGNNEALSGASYTYAGGVQHDHSYTETIYKNADCVNPGEKRFVCECGLYNTEVIPAKGHNFANNYCSNCGKKEYELAKDGTKAKITKYNGNATSIAIPSMIDGFAINAIGDNAFENHSQLVSITIPDGIVEIGNNAFFGTGYYNTAANWDNGVLYIGKYLIEANSLTVGSSYTVKDGTVLIADYAFNACKALRTITFPADLKFIGDSAFSQCTSLQTVNCGVKKDEWSSVDIGSDNAYLNENTLVFVPDPHVVHVYNIVVDSKEATCTTAGYKVTRCECGVEIREDYPATGHIFTNNICAGCNGREYEYSVSSGKVTIEGCHESLNGTINIPTTIGGYKVLGIGDSAFANNNRIKNVVIPQGVTTISANAFYNCDELQIVSIPASVVSIGAFAFADCNKLDAVSVNALNTVYSNDADGVLYKAGKTELVCYPSGKTAEEYIVADSVVIIGNGAFKNITALKKVEIPKSVKTISENAFDGCDNIKDVVFDGTETEWGRVAIRANNTAITNATKEFKDTSDADLAKEHVAELHLENATASSKGISIIITAAENADTIEVYPTTLTTQRAVSVKTEGTVVKLTAEGRYEVSFEDCHKTNNETTSTITIADVTYTVKFVFTRENGGHNYEISVVAPTCVADGYTTYICLTCGAEDVKTGDPALGHKYDKGVFVKNPTCTEEGIKVKECSVCDAETEGHKIEEVIPAKDHSYEKTVVKPTCVENGYTENKCAGCGDKYIGESAAALGHTYGDWIVETEATCIDEGLKFKVCSVCDDETKGHKVEEVIEASGHKYATSVYPPTPTDKGYTYRLCKICGYEKFENEVGPIIAIEKITYDPVQIKRDEVVTIVPILQTVGNMQVDYTVVYESADPSIATVDEKGNVTGAFNGETTIKCTLTDEFGHTYSAVECKVTVKFTIIQWIVWFFRDFLFGWVSDLF